MRRLIKNRGFAILYAVLLVAVVLSVSLSLFNITLKQLILSFTVRESNFAFYAQESGRECAAFWDSFNDPAKNPFGFYTVNLSDPGQPPVFNPPASATLQCGGQTVAVSDAGSCTLGADGCRIFSYHFSGGEVGRELCALVEVEKRIVGNVGLTRIDSRGYNLYDANCPAQSDRVVERASVLVY